MQRSDRITSQLGVVVVDHGSRRAEANQLMQEVARCLRDALGMTNIEPAHMDLAEPSVAAAFDRCVASGARTVVVVPHFLGSGRHVEEDIPHLAAEAAAKHPHVEHRIASPLGLHPLVMGVIRQRIEECMAQDVSAQDVSNSADCGDNRA